MESDAFARVLEALDTETWRLFQNADNEQKRLAAWTMCMGKNAVLKAMRVIVDRGKAAMNQKPT